MNEHTKMQQRIYQQEHKEEIRLQKKKHREETKEQINQYQREYLAKNKDKVALSIKAYAKEHAEEIKEYQKQYRLENKEKLKIYAKEYHDKLNKQLTKEAVMQHGGRCAMCHYDEFMAALEFHHVESKVKKGSAVQTGETDLCVLLCANCHSIHTFGDGLSYDIKGR